MKLIHRPIAIMLSLGVCLSILATQRAQGMDTAIPEKTLATHTISLEHRYANPFVNGVFKDNILLTIHYATDSTIQSPSVDWKAIDKQFKKEIVLSPGQTFAFHDDVLPQFAGKVSKTTNAHFISHEGFKSDGYLVGDGVCHLASVLYWVAKDAGLDTLAPTRHDFAPVPEVPKEFGVSIYSNNQAKGSATELQNLYITNNKDHTVAFEFDYDGTTLTIEAQELI